MGLCGSKIPEAERKKAKVLHLFENWHWAMEGEFWIEVPDKSASSSAGSQKFNGSQKFGGKKMKKQHFSNYAHSHVGFRQTEGKGFIDFTRKQDNGVNYQGTIRVSFEGRFVQFTWLKDEVFSDMRGYLYANTAAQEAWTYSDPVGLISELNVRGTFVARSGETGKFALHKVEPGEESGSMLKVGSTSSAKI